MNPIGSLSIWALKTKTKAIFY